MSDFILPYLSTTKSPQQIMGSLVKGPFAQSISVPPNEVYHVCVMPCFDKKLEASRNDFKSDTFQDVDIVISTLELLDLISSAFSGDAIDAQPEAIKQYIPYKHFSYLPSTHFDSPYTRTTRCCSEEGKSSGGYADYLYHVAAKELFGSDIARVEYKKGRNEDKVEAALILQDTPVLNFAIIYGFRNIQNIVRQIKMKKCPYDFVEVMACPGGCTNGGGQIRAGADSDPNVLLQSVNATYYQTAYEDPASNELGKVLLDKLREGNLVQTQYHHVPKLEITNPLAIMW